MYLKVGPLHGSGFPFAHKGWKSCLPLDVHEQLSHIVLLLWVGPGLQKPEPSFPSMKLHRSTWSKQGTQQSVKVSKLRVTRCGSCLVDPEKGLHQRIKVTIVARISKNSLDRIGKVSGTEGIPGIRVAFSW